MADIKAADVAKLRKATGAGMMDCKKALVEADGDFDKAIETIRKKGKAIANKRADREASEGVVLSGVTDDKKNGVVVVLNCETDFVAKNADFIALTKKFLDAALQNLPETLDELKALTIDGTSINDLVLEQTGIIGEKLDLSYYGKVSGEYAVNYIHPGNRLATVVTFNKIIENEQVGKDIAMQIAAMNPVAIDKDDVAPEIVEKELEIGREQARQEGKPENMLDRIAQGKLGKFFKENTLLNQAFVKDSKKDIRTYLKETDPELKVVAFKRYGLSN